MSEGGMSEGYKRQMERNSAPRGKIALALAKAQSMYGVASRDADSNFKQKGKAKKFASFPSVWQATMPALSACEIAVRSYTYWCILDTPYDDGIRRKGDPDGPKGRAMQVFVVVEFVHSSGETFSSEMPCIPERQVSKEGGNRIRAESQDLAAAKTYWKRQLYQDMAFANIAEEDLDTIERNNGENGDEQDHIDNTAAEEYNKLRKDYVDSCNSYYKRFEEAGRASEVGKIVKECGFDSMRDPVDENDMSKVIIALKEAADKLPKTNDKPDKGGEENGQ